MKKINDPQEFKNILVFLKDNMKSKYTKKDLDFLSSNGFKISEIKTVPCFEQKHVAIVLNNVFNFSLKLNRNTHTMLSAQLELDDKLGSVFGYNKGNTPIEDFIYVIKLLKIDKEKLMSYMYDFSEEVDINKSYKESITHSNYLIAKGEKIYSFNHLNIPMYFHFLGVNILFNNLLPNCLSLYTNEYYSRRITDQEIEKFIHPARRKNKISKLLQGA